MPANNYPNIALSIKQPWAWLIVNGYKDIENRTWPIPEWYLGSKTLIHAGKNYDKLTPVSLVGQPAKINGIEIPPLNQLQFGGIVGIATFTGFVTESLSPWFVGVYGFTLVEAEVLDFMPYRGQLGFFKVGNYQPGWQGEYQHTVRCLNDPAKDGHFYERPVAMMYAKVLRKHRYQTKIESYSGEMR